MPKCFTGVFGVLIAAGASIGGISGRRAGRRGFLYLLIAVLMYLGYAFYGSFGGAARRT